MKFCAYILTRIRCHKRQRERQGKKEYWVSLFPYKFTASLQTWFMWIYLRTLYLHLFDFIENSHFTAQLWTRKWNPAVLKTSSRWSFFYYCCADKKKKKRASTLVYLEAAVIHAAYCIILSHLTGHFRWELNCGDLLSKVLVFFSIALCLLNHFIFTKQHSRWLLEEMNDSNQIEYAHRWLSLLCIQLVRFSSSMIFRSSAKVNIVRASVIEFESIMFHTFYFIFFVVVIFYIK